MNKIFAKIPAGLSHEEEYSEKCSIISSFFRRATWICILAIVVFIILMIGFFGDKITYENLKSFVSTIDSDYFTSSNTGVVIDHTLTQKEKIYSFRDGIIILEEGYVKYVKYNGRMLFSESTFLSNDIDIAVGEEYFILYDKGGHSYSKYSTSGLEKNYRSDFPLYGVMISPSGDYAVFSRPASGNSLVSVYSQRHSLRCEYRSERYLLSASVSSNKEDLLLVSRSVASDRSEYVVTLYSMEDKKNIFQKEYEHEGFVMASTLDDKNSVLAFDGHISILDREGNVKQNYSADGSIIDFDYCAERAVFAIKSNNKINIISVDSEEDRIYNIDMPISNEFRGIACTDDRIYAAASGSVFSIKKASDQYTQNNFDTEIASIDCTSYGCAVILSDKIELCVFN